MGEMSGNEMPHSRQRLFLIPLSREFTHDCTAPVEFAFATRYTTPHAIVEKVE